jgi:hypothetical protein
MREAHRFTDPYSGVADRRNLNDYAAANGWQLLYEASATNGTYVVGWGAKNRRCHAFRYTIATNEIIDLDAAQVLDMTHPNGDLCGYGDPEHFRYHFATDINASGEIVGNVAYGGAFYYSDATGMIDLQAFVDPALHVTIGTASGINDNGEIVGSMSIEGDSKAHAYRIRPPVLLPCPPSPQQCRGTGVRHSVTGLCTYSTVASGTPCPDADRCNGTETCDANGTCQPGSQVVCTAIDACHGVGVCSPATGTCSNPTIPSQGCGTRIGNIEAESFDVAEGVTRTATTVVPVQAGASVEYADVDFGASGQFGRFQVVLRGAQDDQHLEVRLDSKTGQLIANLLTLATEASDPAPQSTRLLADVTGLHRVVIIATSTAVGEIDWFSLEPGIGKDTIATFPATFRHQNPGQGLPDPHNLPVPADSDGEEEDDVPDMAWLRLQRPIDVPAGGIRIVGMVLKDTVRAFARAQWIGSASDVEMSIRDADANLIAPATSSTVQGQGTAEVLTPVVPAQTVGVVIRNTSAVPLTVKVLAGAVRP